MDSGKHSSRGAGLAYVVEGRLLVLWRNKWESENMSLLVPGGMVGDEEDFVDGAIREMEEETGIVVDRSDLRIMFRTSTKWAKEYIFFTTNSSANLGKVEDYDVVLEEDKFSGYLWIPVSNKDIMNKLYPLMLDGLKSLCREMGWV